VEFARIPRAKEILANPTTRKLTFDKALGRPEAAAGPADGGFGVSCSSAAPRRDWLTNWTISAGSRDSNNIGLPVSYGSPYELYSGWDWICLDTATVASPASKTFTIQNTGNADLTLDLNSLSATCATPAAVHRSSNWPLPRLPSLPKRDSAPN
jgi:hypothetical protein